MEINRFLAIFTIAAACAALSACARAATGVGIGPAEVTISNLRPGGSYDLGAIGGLKWDIENRGDATATVTVRSVAPDPKSLPAGYEPVPDPAWLIPSGEIFRDVAPKQSVAFSATLKIPGGNAYLGKNYAAALEATAAAGGSRIGIGVAANARVLFTTAADLPATGTEPAPDTGSPVSINTSPYIIDAGEVRAGAVTASLLPLTIVNPGAADIEVRLEQITLMQSKLRTAPDCESLPDGSFLVFENRSLTIPARETLQAPFYIALPDKKEYKGKKYAIVINASVVKNGLSVGTYTVVKFKVL